MEVKYLKLSMSQTSEVSELSGYQFSVFNNSLAAYLLDLEILFGVT